MIKQTVGMCSLLLATSLAQAAPTAFQASYTVNVDGLTLGSMNASLRYDGNTYTYQKLTKANGLAAILSGDVLNENSKGVRQGEQLLPNSYSLQHKSKRKNRLDEVKFTSNTHVQENNDGNAIQLDVPTGTIDPALMELRMMDDLAANKPLTYHTANRGKLHTYTFRKLGKETLETPAGRFECEKIQHTDANGERKTTVWLAPQLGYGIVQAQHNDDGQVIETRLTSYK
jgi:hypothetical protein